MAKAPRRGRKAPFGCRAWSSSGAAGLPFVILGGLGNFSSLTFSPLKNRMERVFHSFFTHFSDLEVFSSSSTRSLDVLGSPPG